MSAAQERRDPAQGPAAIRLAAFQALAEYLDSFSESVAREDLWQNHPRLLDYEATRALQIADEFARQTRDHLRYLAMIES